MLGMKRFRFHFKELAILILFFFIFSIISCGKKEYDKEGQGYEVSEYDIKGNVKLSGETEHSGIAVFVGGTQIVAYTDEYGNFLISGIQKGKYQLWAQKSGFKQTRFQKVIVGGNNKVVDIGSISLYPSESEAKGISSVSGKVDLTDATDFSGVVVSIENTNYQTETDSEGLFLIRDVKPGLYVISFNKEGYKSYSDTIEVRAGEHFRFTTIPLDPMSVEELRASKREYGISTDEGRTIAGYITIKNLDGSSSYDFSNVKVRIDELNYVNRTDSNGNFYFSYLNPNKYTVSATLEGYKLVANVSADVTDSDFRDVILVLQEIEPETQFGAIRGMVTLEDEEDFSGVMVIIPGTNYYATTGSDGVFRFEDVPFGSYSLVAKIEGFDTFESEAFEIDKTEMIDVGEIYLEKSIDYPTVVYTDPADNTEIEVKRRVPIYVKFSKKMDINSVKSALSITPKLAYRSFMGKESKDSSFDLLQIMLLGNDIDFGLRFNKIYTIRIGQGAEDSEGYSLQEDYVFKLKTARASIINTYPANGAKDIYLRSGEYVRVYFNAPMDHDSIENNIKFSPPLKYIPIVNVVDDINDGWTELRINYAWDPETKYTITVGKKAITVGKDRLSNTPYKLTFTTGRLVNSMEMKSRIHRF